VAWFLAGVLWSTTVVLDTGTAVAAEQVVRVRDFGAVGDGRADDGPAIRAALAHACATGRPTRVVFEPVTYRLMPWTEHWYALHLLGAHDVTLDGNGATLLVDPASRALFLERCERVTVRGFTVDYDPLPCTQGDVLEVNVDEAWFRLRLHAGYPEPPSQEWVEANGGAGDWRHGVFTDGPRGHFTHAWAPVERVEPLAERAREYRIHVPTASRDSLRPVQAGHCFAMRVPCITADRKAALFAQGQDDGNRGVFLKGGPLSNIRLAHSRQCTLEDIRQVMAPDMGINLFDTRGTVLRRVEALRKPGTDRLMAGMSDGVHCKGNLEGPTFEDCSFEALGDDSINISHHPEVVLEQHGPREVLTQYGDIVWFDSPIEPGDLLEAFDPVRGVVLGEARVARSEFVANQKRLLTVDRDLPTMREARAGAFDDATQLYRLPTGRFRISGCTFRSQLKTAMLVRRGGTIEGCDVRDCAYGVTAYNCERFREGPFPRDLVIRGTRFENVWIGAVNILALAPQLAAPLGTGIEIVGNEIRQRDGSGIELTQLAEVELRDNRVTLAPETPSNWLAVHLVGSGRVEIDGLRVEDPRPDASGAVVLERMAREALVLRGLDATLAPGVPQVRVR
jgi:hypothetical protein